MAMNHNPSNEVQFSYIHESLMNGWKISNFFSKISKLDNSKIVKRKYFNFMKKYLFRPKTIKLKFIEVNSILSNFNLLRYLISLIETLWISKKPSVQDIIFQLFVMLILAV